MPKSVPLRAMVVMTELPSMPRAASTVHLDEGIVRLRKKWSFACMNDSTLAMRSRGWSSRTRNGASSRIRSDVPARLRLWPSSPICSTCAIRLRMSMGPCSASASDITGASSVSIQRRRSSTSAEKAP